MVVGVILKVSMPLVSSGQNNAPVYYRAFWGFITEITEDYNAGLTTLSLQCSDMLTWWKYQKLTISPNEYTAIFNSGNLAANAFPTIFRNRNPWQIITQLLYETQWLSLDKNATFNFAYQSFPQSQLFLIWMAYLLQLLVL